MGEKKPFNFWLYWGLVKACKVAWCGARVIGIEGIQKKYDDIMAVLKRQTKEEMLDTITSRLNAAVCEKVVARGARSEGASAKDRKLCLPTLVYREAWRDTRSIVALL
jgi:hypothetical protein